MASSLGHEAIVAKDGGESRHVLKKLTGCEEDQPRATDQPTLATELSGLAIDSKKKKKM